MIFVLIYPRGRNRTHKRNGVEEQELMHAFGVWCRYYALDAYADRGLESRAVERPVYKSIINVDCVQEV